MFPEPLVEEATSALIRWALSRIRISLERLGDHLPKVGRPDLTYERSDGCFWVDGFWPGQLWLAFAETGDEAFLRGARRLRPYFERRLPRRETHDHDLGCIFTLATVADYKLTGDGRAREMALAAARSLLSRFNPSGGFLKAWNAWPDDPADVQRKKKGRTII